MSKSQEEILQKKQEKLMKKQEKINNKLKKIDEDINDEIRHREYIQANEDKLFEHKAHRQEVHKKNAPPQRSILEEVGNSVTHGVGALCGVAAFILMLAKASGFRENFSAFIYGISMIFMMLMSCIYHALPSKSMGKHVLRRFDYTSIYILIGGTFTPIFLMFIYNLNSVLAVVFCSIQWAIIIAGITNVCIFGPGRHKYINMTLYIVLGWCGIMFIPYLYKHMPTLLWYILAGGIIYTIGIIPFIIKKRAAHFLWHFFVLGGAAVQFIGIFITLFCK